MDGIFTQGDSGFIHTLVLKQTEWTNFMGSLMEMRNYCYI